jgi:glucose-1-phosphatase
MRLTAGNFDALVFDLGRVVIDFDLNRAFARWAEHVGCRPSELAERFAVDETYRRHERGEVSDEAFFAGLRRLLQIELTDDQFLAGWNAIFTEEMPDINALLERAARRAPLYLLSNTNPAHIAYLKSRFASVLGHFQQLFLSSAIGARKPEPAVFDYITAVIGAPPHRIVFFDDLLENVEAARDQGMIAVHVRTSADIADAFHELGID